MLPQRFSFLAFLYSNALPIVEILKVVDVKKRLQRYNFLLIFARKISRL
jgi:hypothetical protein